MRVMNSGDGWVAIVIVVTVLFAAIIIGVAVYFRVAKQTELDETLEQLAAGTKAMTPEEFFELRNYSFGGQGRPKYAKTKNFEGVYILHNKTKDLYYIGQAKKILDRVNNHFTGKGNGDVYADYKYGDKFVIRMIALEGSGFESLNELERNMIAKYDAVSKGYNKTKGNRN